MLNSISKHRIAVILLSISLLLLSLGFCSTGYTSEIQDHQDIIRLSENSKQLKLLNQDSQMRLNTVEKRLLTSEERLERISMLMNISNKKLAISESRVKVLETRLESSERTSRIQEESLKNLNLSFKEYSQEQKKKINELKLQRLGLIALLLIAVAAK